MKRIALVYFIVSIEHVLPVLHAQRTEDATLVDSMGEVGYELLLNRLDYLAAEVSNQPGAAGFAVLYPGANPFTNAAYERCIKNNFSLRNFPAHLVQPIWVQGNGTLKIEMWKVTGSARLPFQEAPLTYRIPDVSSRKRFVEGDAEVVKIDGKPAYVSGSGNCVQEFNLSVVAKVLSANPRLSAEIVIFNRSCRNTRTLSRLIREGAFSENKIPANRLKIIYGGRGIAKEWSSDISAIDLWLLPIKGK